MKKIISLCVIVACATVVAFAGGQFASGAIDIGIAMPETHVERWQRDGAALKADAEKMGYKAEVAYADADQSKQNKQISDFITKGAKIIIVGSVDAGAAEAAAEAKEEGVMVIAYDRLIENSDAYNYYVTFDNDKVGQIQGKAIEKALSLASGSRSNKKNIVLFAGAPTDNNAKYFFDGAMNVLRPYVKKGMVNLVGPAPLSSSDRNFTKITTEYWKANIAKARMENLLNGDARNVTIDAVLAPNDTLARAIIEALSSDAKYDTTDKLPVVTGQDGEIASIKMIRDGKQYMTVFKDTRKLASLAINLASAMSSMDKNMDKDMKMMGMMDMASVRVDTESYNTGKKTVTTFLLDPVKVTADNYKKVFIDSGYYTAEQLQ